jgi:rare lipoprotein A
MLGHDWQRGAQRSLVGAAILVSGCANAAQPTQHAAAGWTGHAHGNYRSPGFEEIGEASYYGPGWHGRRTASGERFDMNALTAAHRTLPFGTHVKVISEATGREVEVVITDRIGTRHRIIDLSREAARELGMIQSGTAQVRLTTAD